MTRTGNCNLNKICLIKMLSSSVDIDFHFIRKKKFKRKANKHNGIELVVGSNKIKRNIENEMDSKKCP